VCVCPAACRRTHTTYDPEIWHGLLISPGLGTKLGGDPKCWPPGVPLIVTPSEKPWRVQSWAGASKQKTLLGRVHSTKWGICIDNFAVASKQKLLLGVGLPGKILFAGGLTPTPGPQGPLIQMGVYALRIERRPANKSRSLGWVYLVKF
jgi:hypothetical protein